MSTENKTQQRIETLEMRIAFQDDTIEQLNDVVYKLQNEMADLTFKVEYLVKKLKDTQPSQMADASEETPPPHY